MKKSKLSFRMMKSQFTGLGILGFVILVGQITIKWWKNQREYQPIKIEIVETNSQKKIELKKFNPNES